MEAPRDISLRNPFRHVSEATGGSIGGAAATGTVKEDLVKRNKSTAYDVGKRFVGPSRKAYDSFTQQMGKLHDDYDKGIGGPNPTEDQAAMVAPGSPYARGAMSPLGGKAKE